MTKAYQGKNEKGEWEQFEWDEELPPTTEETGYEEIEEITSDSRI